MKKTLGGLLLLACVFPGNAFAQKAPGGYTRCKYITDISVPITTPGTYCLNKSFTGTGLVIDSNDVSLDMRGYSIINSQVALGHLYAWGNQVGIRSENRNNITVRNGTVIGFDFGVRLGYPAGARTSVIVENILVRKSKAAGIAVLGYDTVIVRNNTVKDTVGPQCTGIAADGRDDPAAGGAYHANVTIEGNRVDNTRSGTQSVQGYLAAGIRTSFGQITTITNNVVTDVAADMPGYSANGIDMQVMHPQSFTVDGNIVMNSATAAWGSGMYIVHGDPAYTGPIVINGVVNDSRVYNFPQGIIAVSDQIQNGKPVHVVNTSFSYNVVGAYGPAPAYSGGEMVGSTNRTE